MPGLILSLFISVALTFLIYFLLKKRLSRDGIEIDVKDEGVMSSEKSVQAILKKTAKQANVKPVAPALIEQNAELTDAEREAEVTFLAQLWVNTPVENGETKENNKSD